MGSRFFLFKAYRPDLGLYSVGNGESPSPLTPDKAVGDVLLNTQPHLFFVSNKWSYICTPPYPLMACTGVVGGASSMSPAKLRG